MIESHTILVWMELGEVMAEVEEVEVVVRMTIRSLRMELKISCRFRASFHSTCYLRKITWGLCFLAMMFHNPIHVPSGLRYSAIITKMSDVEDFSATQIELMEGPYTTTDDLPQISCHLMEFCCF